MTGSHQGFDLASLPPEERYELAMTLLDSIFGEREVLPVPPAQLAEVRRRVAEMDADPAPGEPWRAVVDRVLNGR